MKTLFIHPVLKLARNGTLGLLKPLSRLRPPIKLPAGGFLLILALNSLSAHAGIITTIAGTGTASYNGDGGTATTAQLKNPIGVTFDSSGNLYIADSGNNRLRKVTPGGVISTVAGTGTAGFSGDGGAAISAQLKTPTDVVVDSSGNLYIADYVSNRIRQVTPGGVISTIAGTGTAAYNGDGGVATSAQLYSPMAVAVDSSGNLYIADSGNNRIRKISTGGIISTVAGTGTAGYSGDGGAATSAQLNIPIDVAVDSSGNLYIADTYNNRIRQVTPGGVISTVAGIGTAGYSGDGGAATGAQLRNPRGVAIDSRGNLYIADIQNNRIRQVTSTGIISTVAGTGTTGFSGDGGAATSAKLNTPYRVAVDSSDNLYIADSSNHRIRKIDFRQTIAFTPPASGIYLGGATLTATATSGLPVTFASTTTSICTVSGTTVNYIGVGTCTITADQAGDTNYFAAPPVTGNIPVGQASQTISFTPLTNGTAGGSATLIATATSGLAVTFASMTTKVCTVSGTTVNYVDVGTCTVTADQAGNAIYLAASQVSANWFINPPLLSDINVRQGSTNIPSGGSFDVGPSGIGHHVHYTFTIDNLGNIDLILSGTLKIRVSGTNAGEFSVDDTATISPIVAGTSTTFILTFIPTSLGNKTATLTLANNDQDEGNYTVTVTGTSMPHKNLQVTVAGSGQGMVTSKPEGVDCEVNGECLMPVIDAPQWVYLTAVPATGSIFTGWSGDPACQADGKVFVMADTACVATFELNSYTLTVEKNASTATVTGEGINCPDTCQASYLYGTTVKLEASQAPLEWEFVGWGGSCDSQGQVTITADKTCRAQYREDPNIPALGDGNGDGQLDAHQANVMSLADKMAGNYITLEVNPECVIADGDTVLAETQPGHNSHYPAPQGLMYFDIQCSQATVTMYFHGLSQLRRNFKFRKFGPTTPGDVNTTTSYEFPAQFGIQMIDGKPVVTATYTLVDGQLGDSTGVDGRIVDPGGVVVK